MSKSKYPSHGEVASIIALMSKRTHGKELKERKYRGIQKKKTSGDYQKGRELMHPGQELKAFDVSVTASNFTATGVITLCNGMVNGSELFNRVGRKIYAKSIHLRGVIQSIATGAADIGRIIVVYDAQSNASNTSFTTLSTLLQDSNAASSTSAFSQINLANRSRFKILRDIQVLLPPQTNTAGVITNLGPMDQVRQSLSIDEFIKMKGLESVYNGGGSGSVTDINSGAIYVVTLSNNSNVWQFDFTTRLRYWD